MASDEQTKGGRRGGLIHEIAFKSGLGSIPQELSENFDNSQNLTVQCIPDQFKAVQRQNGPSIVPLSRA
ncbi:hypothetical protein [Thermococcus celericrescens]|uniref:hypothetical protein n=1 Tax=Thermococcus celericrescens TaxID=227598 RepID=UPI0012ED6AD9|nr:hypothetical protein [Thermococcus celericrescens]